MAEISEASSMTTEISHPKMKFAFATSLAIATLSAIASLCGWLNPNWFYPSEALRQFALANDLVNLFIGLPILLGSMWLARRGKLAGLLLWPGALMYTLYNYLAYVISMPVSWVYLAYLAIVSMSMYSLIGVAASINGDTTRKRLAGKVPERLSGGVLFILGGFVFVRVFSVVAGAVLDETVVPSTELALLLADVMLAPSWIIGGVLLWRKRKLGYAIGLGLLFQGSMLFIGLIIVLALQPLFSAAVFPTTDIIVVTIMGLICFVPFALFLRAAWRSKEAAS